MSSQRDLEIVSPSPVPPKLRALEESTWWKGLKISSRREPQVNLLFRLFNKAQYIAHPENAGHNPLRVKYLQRVRAFPCSDELHRLAGYFTRREGGTAAGVPIRFGQNNSGQRERGSKRNGRIGGILPRHAVNHK
jgi:hypothetical protein